MQDIRSASNSPPLPDLTYKSSGGSRFSVALPAEDDEIINIGLVDFVVALKSPIVITQSQMSKLSQFSAASSVSGFLEEKVEALSSLPQRVFFFFLSPIEMVSWKPELRIP